MKLMFTQDCLGYRKGQVCDFDRGVADVFVNWRKVAVWVENEAAPPPATPEAAPEPAVEFMVPRRRVRVKVQEE